MNSRQSVRIVVALTLLAVWPVTTAYAQEAPVKYLRGNTGNSGFQGIGVKVRNENQRGIKAGDFIIWHSLMLEAR